MYASSPVDQTIHGRAEPHFVLMSCEFIIATGGSACQSARRESPHPIADHAF